MKNRTISSVATALAACVLASAPGYADDGQLSPERLNMADRMGYFSPAFKTAVHDLVDAKHALEKAQAETTKLSLDLPELQNQAAEADKKTAALHRELAKYDRPDEADFATLQQKLNDPTAKVEDRIALAQAYVWTYPASPHQNEAQQDLQEMQRKVADQLQAEKEAEDAQQAARAKLLQRAQARDLNLAEWRELLRDMSQDELLNLLGRPTSQSGDYWIYSGNWITDPTTHQKVGLVINFNGGRVLSVSEPPVAE